VRASLPHRRQAGAEARWCGWAYRESTEQMFDLSNQGDRAYACANASLRISLQRLLGRVRAAPSDGRSRSCRRLPELREPGQHAADQPRGGRRRLRIGRVAIHEWWWRRWLLRGKLRLLQLTGGQPGPATEATTAGCTAVPVRSSSVWSTEARNTRRCAGWGPCSRMAARCSGAP
jgi:hypothetical protein